MTARRWTLVLFAFTFLAGGWLAAHHAMAHSAATSTGPLIGHMVYFKLKEPTAESKARMVALCREYLKGHEGEVWFGAGVVGNEFDREVNDRDWDVALHIVFKDKTAHDKYADHPRHLEFIKLFREHVAKVRVFDSLLEPENVSK
ncbi:MAG TPA: Dabb family protein [Gemmatales bacterium]|nr:Dabb family protein [Gemmatales bacterium]